MRRAVPTQNDIKRAIKAARDAGLDIANVKVTASGIEIVTTNGAATANKNTWDEVLDDGAAR